MSDKEMNILIYEIVFYVTIDHRRVTILKKKHSMVFVPRCRMIQKWHRLEKAFL